ncbi:hypothetical protein [Halocalculus aciditolerans]|uniref:Uncharacterized protein n=1 Tax=Halocalculus aciditolerans TaxID=1383812 RepID=A0A830FJF3_9EURY|nr:hypothetical protein [Halocalculus aciditolerans]GGL58604.1 hypothetical protein GCM10009039_16060 [Halocalculus aciditolerans]
MDMNRRKVLLGMGTAAIGSGAAFGSGAFTSVTADRTASFTVSADDSAYLTLSGDGDYVSASGNPSNTIKFTFDNLNENATTKVDGALTISDNGSDSASKYVWVTGGDSTLSSGGTVDLIEQSNSGSIVSDTNAVDLSTQDTVGELTADIEIDTSNGDPSGLTTITVHAQDSDPNAQ